MQGRRSPGLCDGVRNEQVTGSVQAASVSGSASLASNSKFLRGSRRISARSFRRWKASCQQICDTCDVSRSRGQISIQFANEPLANCSGDTSSSSSTSWMTSRCAIGAPRRLHSTGTARGVDRPQTGPGSIPRASHLAALAPMNGRFTRSTIGRSSRGG